MVNLFNPAGRGTGVQGGINAAQDLFSGIQQREEFDRQAKVQKQNDFYTLDKQRQGAIFQDAQAVNSFLKAGQPEQALGVLSNRMGFIEQFGGNPSDTKEVADFILSGDIQGATNLLDSVVDVGIKQGFLSDPLDRQEKKARIDNLKSNGGLSSEGRTFNKMLEDLTPKERDLAKRIKLGLSPRAVGSSSQTISQDEQLTKDVAESEAAITGAKEASKLQSQLKLSPKIAQAVALSTASANLIGAQNKEDRSNKKALAVYDVAFKSLGEALGNAYTGPIAGLMPALTSSAQTAQGAVAMVLPTLKGIFREAGEGTFTDSDQKLLTDMAPTRTDKTATIKWKLNAIDSIVRTKLGSNQQKTPQPSDTTKSLNFDAQGKLIQ